MLTRFRQTVRPRQKILIGCLAVTTGVMAYGRSRREFLHEQEMLEWKKDLQAVEQQFVEQRDKVVEALEGTIATNIKLVPEAERAEFRDQVMSRFRLLVTREDTEPTVVVSQVPVSVPATPIPTAPAPSPVAQTAPTPTSTSTPTPPAPKSDVSQKKIVW
eukprot:c4868_g1_i1.p1 GENE.c4868_g1_i1~~c4868_g1_i1.p1  ORF type:complete len:160 (+),score=41.15 c4868_g1_i1:48-527(+)